MQFINISAKYCNEIAQKFFLYSTQQKKAWDCNIEEQDCF